MQPESIRCAFKDSLPALFGYLPLGLAFGALTYHNTGIIWLGTAMSFFVYAGAAQFMCLNVIMNNGTLLEIAVTTFVVNLRHIFYGIPFLTAFTGNFFKKTYLIFGITDETYAILSASPKKYDTTYSLWVTALTHGYWVFGTLLGSYLGAQVSWDISPLNFALIALFVILAIEQAYSVKDVMPFVYAAVSFGVCQVVPSDYFLTACMGICAVLTVLDYKVRGESYECS